jgi:uncharacterized protein YjiK
MGIRYLIIAAACIGGVLNIAPSCEDAAASDPVQRPGENVLLDYDLGSPDTVIVLPRRLREISGLSLEGDSVLVGVQDERGRLYGISARNGEIVSESDFGGAGDYEAVEIVGGDVWIARSNGDLYVRSYATGDRARRIRTPLSARDDVESLAWSRRDQKLLIAAKERLDKNRNRVLFAFDVASETLDEEVWGTISLKDVSTMLGIGRRAALKFKPSAAAMHPVTGELFVVSSALPAIAVLDTTRRLSACVSLDKELLPQPEGIAFSSQGILYLASEGRTHGILAVFRPREPQ